MLGSLFFAYMLAMGLLISGRLLAAYPRYIRFWAGGVFGLIFVMWLPSLWSFIFGFGIAAHLLSLPLPALLLVALILMKKPRGTLKGPADKDGLCMLYAVLPMLVLTFVIMMTHYLWQDASGAYHVGQSTWGDTSLHLGIATGLVEQGIFPPDYTILPGRQINYPFLGDIPTATMLLFGSGIRAAFMVPGIWMAAVVYSGFFILALEISGKKSAAVLAFVLFFLNGGFGFAYFLDGAKANPSVFTSQFEDFYRTPTNLIGENMRWSNVLCDMMIPQRTLLAGWSVLFFAMWGVYKGLHSGDKTLLLCSGIAAGFMPLIHTHSYLALGLCCIAWLIVYFVKSASDGISPAQYIKSWLWFGLPAVLMAVPQLICFTFRQTGASTFLFFKFNWANDTDPWIWFWFKNAGIAAICAVPAFLGCGKKVRAAACGIIPIYLLAEFIQIQPNPYDNNKLFYVGYALAAIMIAVWMVKIYERLRGMRGRAAIAAIIIFLSTFSAALTIGRELNSDYELYSSEAVQLAEYVKDNTEKDDLFLTSDNFNNVISSLAGRYIYCGTGSYLYFHGFNEYFERQADVRQMYEDPDYMYQRAAAIGIDYIVFSPYEAGAYNTYIDYFTPMYPIAAEFGSYRLLAVSDKARARFGQ